MDIKEFTNNYLHHYLLLENDFVGTMNYVTVSQDNFNTHSVVYLKQLLSIGSEIDIMKKLIATILKPSFDERKDNANLIILENEPNIKIIEINVKKVELNIKPWDYSDFPDWWTAYNEIKHNRLANADKLDNTKKYYQFASLKNVLYSLAALFSLELIAYRLIAINNNENLFVPYINSLFSIQNLYWKDIKHGNGMVLTGSTLYISD